MQLRRVRAEEAPMRRYLTELWVPYHHELGEIVESKGLADTFALEDELAWQIEQFETPDSRLWVALDGLADPTVPCRSRRLRQRLRALLVPRSSPHRRRLAGPTGW